MPNTPETSILHVANVRDGVGSGVGRETNRDRDDSKRETKAREIDSDILGLDVRQ